MGPGPLGPWAHLGPGPTWARGPLRPWAHSGPESTWARAHWLVGDYLFNYLSPKHWLEDPFHWGGFAPPNPPLPVGLRPPVPPELRVARKKKRAFGEKMPPEAAGGGKPYFYREKVHFVVNNCCRRPPAEENHTSIEKMCNFG